MVHRSSFSRLLCARVSAGGELWRKAALYIACWGLLGSAQGQAGAARSAEFIPLGVIGDGCLACRDFSVSGDGNVVVGAMRVAPQQTEAYRWTRSEGLVGLGEAVGANLTSRTWDVSPDGGEIIGNAGTTGFLWTTGNVVQTPFGAVSQPRVISDDGRTIAGFHNTPQGGIGMPFLWTEEDGAATLSLRQGQYTFIPAGISGDGSIVVGGGNDGAFDSTRAFYWTESKGFIPLDALPGSTNDFSFANAISSDGMVIVGTATSALDHPEAFRWTAATGMVGLGDLHGGQFGGRANAVSGDGAVIVGASESETGPEAFLWTEDFGMRSLQEVLVADYELASFLDGWFLSEATDLSLDGSAIVGWGLNPAGVKEGWLIDLNAVLPTLPGDADGDGFVDLKDFNLLKAAFGTSLGDDSFLAAADFNHDEAIDLVDFNILKTHFGETNAVPEPNGAVLTVLGCLAAVAFRLQGRRI